MSSCIEQASPITSNLGAGGMVFVGEDVLASLIPAGHTTSQPLSLAACTSPRTPQVTPDTADGITVALEVKFLLPFLVRGRPDGQPQDPRRVFETDFHRPEARDQLQRHAYTHIAETIRTAGEASVTATEIARQCSRECDFWDTHWIVKKSNSAEPGPDELALGAQTGTREEQGEEVGGMECVNSYVWASIEIASPKLSAHPAEQLQRTQSRLLSVLTALITQHRLVVNYTCDIHVHLGRMDGAPIELATLRRLASILWLAEPTLRSIRDPASPNYLNQYTWGHEMRRHSRLAQTLRATMGENMTRDINRFRVWETSELQKGDVRKVDNDCLPPRHLNALGHIMSATSHLQLGRLLSGHNKRFRRLGFNFSAFGEEDERARTNPKTVEVRIMDGTLRTDLILSWLSICVRLLEVAIVKKSDRWAKVVDHLMRTTLEEDDEGEEVCDLNNKAEDASMTGNTYDTDFETPPTAMFVQKCSGTRWSQRFGRLMQELGLPHETYHAFQEKIIVQRGDGMPGHSPQ